MLHVWSHKKLRKTIATAALTTFAATGIILPAWADDTQQRELIVTMTIGDTSYQANGKEATMDCAPYVDENNRTMVPVRFVGQALGATVNWNPSAKTVLIADEENTVVFAIDSDEMTVNGRTMPIDTAAVIQDNRAMLPLRAVAESIGATVTYADGVITISRKAPSEIVTVVNYQELKQALSSKASTIILDKSFSTQGELVQKLIVERPVVLDGNNNKIDFGIEIVSEGVTVKNFIINISDFDKGVSTGGQSDLKNPGDCVAIEIHNDATGRPVVISNNNIKLDVFGSSNSAIYLADNSYVEISGNTILLENKENNTYERGGIFVGAGVSGSITNNDITSSRTAIPMSPIGLTANLDTLTKAVAVPSVTIQNNTIKTRYMTKMYVSGQLFGDDRLVLERKTDFGARQALSDFIVALAENNTYEIAAPYPAEHEAGFVQCRLDNIMAGGTYFENNVFFYVEDEKLVRVPAPNNP